jgi:hypothetical protein
MAIVIWRTDGSDGYICFIWRRDCVQPRLRRDTHWQNSNWWPPYGRPVWVADGLTAHPDEIRITSQLFHRKKCIDRKTCEITSFCIVTQNNALHDWRVSAVLAELNEITRNQRWFGVIIAKLEPIIHCRSCNPTDDAQESASEKGIVADAYQLVNVHATKSIVVVDFWLVLRHMRDAGICGVSVRSPLSRRLSTIVDPTSFSGVIKRLDTTYLTVNRCISLLIELCNSLSGICQDNGRSVVWATKRIVLIIWSVGSRDLTEMTVLHVIKRSLDQSGHDGVLGDWKRQTKLIP